MLQLQFAQNLQDCQNQLVPNGLPTGFDDVKHNCSDLRMVDPLVNLDAKYLEHPESQFEEDLLVLLTFTALFSRERSF